MIEMLIYVEKYHQTMLKFNQNGHFMSACIVQTSSSVSLAKISVNFVDTGVKFYSQKHNFFNKFHLDYFVSFFLHDRY